MAAAAGGQNQAGQQRKGFSDLEKAELKDAFAVFDKNGDGGITTKELGEVLSAVSKRKFTQAELSRIMKRWDNDGNGEIDFGEFLAFMEQKSAGMGEIDELKEAFSVFDRDGGGTITADEIAVIMTALGEKLTKDDIALMIKAVDTDGNGSVDFEEFKRMMQDGPPQF